MARRRRRTEPCMPATTAGAPATTAVTAPRKTPWGSRTRVAMPSTSASKTARRPWPSPTASAGRRCLRTASSHHPESDLAAARLEGLERTGALVMLPTTVRYAFGDFELDTSAWELRARGEIVAV